MRRTSSNLSQMSRADQRRQRLLELEWEQRQEDAEAIKMTQEQLQSLLHCFRSVKFEYSDLDGLSRHGKPHGAYHCYPTKTLTKSTMSSAYPDNKRISVLCNNDLESFSGEDTIRASVSTRPPLHADLMRTPKSPALHSVSLKCRHRDGTRTRSPIKGVFSQHQHQSPGSPVERASWLSSVFIQSNPRYSSQVALPRHPNETNLQTATARKLPLKKPTIDMDSSLEKTCAGAYHNYDPPCNDAPDDTPKITYQPDTQPSVFCDSITRACISV